MKMVLTYMKSFSRFLFVLFVLLATFIFTMFQGGLVSWTIFYALLPFLIYSILLFFYPMSNLKVTREILTKNIQSGGKLQVIVTVKRKYRFPLLYMAITEQWSEEDALESANGHSNKLLYWGFRRELTWTYELTEIPRGKHIFTGIDIELMDFFLWIRKKRFVPIADKVYVYPKIVEMTYKSVNKQQLDHGITSTLFNMMKDTTMVSSVRSYEAGDRVSLIHWKSFARTGELMTKEFEDRKSQDVYVILDSRPSATFEEQIILAASILKVAKDYQGEIGFMSRPIQKERSDGQVFPVLKTEVQHQAVLKHLASVKPVHPSYEHIFDKEVQKVPKNSTVLIVTGDPNWSFLQSFVGPSINSSSIICFVVMNEQSEADKDILENIEIAKHRGINVRAIMLNQFSEAFNEVTFS